MVELIINHLAIWNTFVMYNHTVCLSKIWAFQATQLPQTEAKLFANMLSCLDIKEAFIDAVA
jgi:hypothetical protein